MLAIQKTIINLSLIEYTYKVKDYIRLTKYCIEGIILVILFFIIFLRLWEVKGS